MMITHLLIIYGFDIYFLSFKMRGNHTQKLGTAVVEIHDSDFNIRTDVDVSDALNIMPELSNDGSCTTPAVSMTTSVHIIILYLLTYLTTLLQMMYILRPDDALKFRRFGN